MLRGSFESVQGDGVVVGRCEIGQVCDQGQGVAGKVILG